MLTTNGLLSKHLSSPRVNFDATRLSFTAYMTSNAVLLFIALIYWTQVSFHKEMFWVGLGGSIIDNIGDVLMINAYAIGPSGAVSALISLQSVIMTILEIAKTGKVPSAIEICALLLALFGGLVMVIPE